MILADKISELRKKNGWSQEELAEKLEVSRQSISKWEGAQSVPDMNRILKMSEIFGVSTDYLLKDQMELPQEDMGTGKEEPGLGKRKEVSMEEAVSFLQYRQSSSKRVALGVMMCILSPVILIILSGLQEAEKFHISEAAANAGGLLVLLLMVAGAVALFLVDDFRGKRFEYLEKEAIDTSYGVDGMVKDRRERYSQSYMVQLVTGILLCVLAAVPIFLTVLVFGENDMAAIISVGVLLGLVAVGTLLIVHASMIWGSFQILLQEGDYTIEQKEETRKNEYLAAVYWGLAVTVYLAWSFISGAWDKTWIVWPIAGVAYGVVTAIARMIRRKA